MNLQYNKSESNMYRRRGRARDVTGSLPTGAPIGARRDSRHTPSQARAGCGPGKLMTDPKKLRGSLSLGSGIVHAGLVYVGLKAPHDLGHHANLVLLVLSN